MPRAATRSPSDIAYEQVRTVALRFPSAEEKLSHGAPSFHVRGKMFLTFVDNHHGDGHLAVWCKSTHEEQKRLVEDNPSRFVGRRAAEAHALVAPRRARSGNTAPGKTRRARRAAERAAAGPRPEQR
jgi:hypothetical protein